MPQSVFEARKTTTGLAWETPRSVQIDATIEQKKANEEKLTVEQKEAIYHVVSTKSYSTVKLTGVNRKNVESASRAKAGSGLLQGGGENEEENEANFKSTRRKMINHTENLNRKDTLGVKNNRETGKPMVVVHHALMTRIQCAPESPTFLRTSSSVTVLSSMVG
jgi:hypothetical protein